MKRIRLRLYVLARIGENERSISEMFAEVKNAAKGTCAFAFGSNHQKPVPNRVIHGEVQDSTGEIV